MSVKHRVTALEKKSVNGFRMVCVRELDKQGGTFEEAPSKKEVQGVRFLIGEERLEVWRGENEKYEHFCERSAALAHEQLNPTVLLPFYMRYI